MMETKEALLKYLDLQQVMTLATRGKHMEACTVYFSVDKDLNFFFISHPETEHCQNIAINPEVACAIADGRQNVSDKKIGVQIKGKATELSSLEKVGAALAFWSKANFDIGEAVSLEQIKNRVLLSKAYRITPSEIKFFNEDLFGPGGFDIIHP